MSEQDAHPILDFWFGPFDSEGRVQPAREKSWWKKDPEFDALCRKNFETEVQAARAGQREGLKETAEGALAFIILCDQIPRNIYRDTPGAFASDELALAATQLMLDNDWVGGLKLSQRGFALMPLMHSEDPAVHVTSVAQFAALQDQGESQLSFAERHKEIIDRFGRYPHRNKILGRESTAEEIEFLSQPGSSF